MTALLLAAAVAALATGGLLLVVAGLRGAPAGSPGGGPSGRGRRWWSGRVRPTGRRVRTALAVGAGLAAYALTGVPGVGLLAAAAVPGLPWLWQVGHAEQVAIARMEALTDWIRRLRDQLATGSGLVSAVVATAAAAPAPVADAVRGLAVRLRAGTDPAGALRAFAADLADPVADQVVAALLLHLRDRGQHLQEVLSAVAADAATQVALRREIHARRTQARATVRFMTVFGAVVVLVLARTDLLAVYTTPAGQVVLVALSAAFVGTLAWVRAMSRPAPQPRFLPGDG
ncbi:MAG TPA: type II secretion system F family protein [Natronosporangium sp.]|nr:type II secretion system F family protein [Natronosporangium sp.]